MYKFVFFVPESHLETVKQAVFEAGAGQIGQYDQCCWQVAGQGQFRALEGSQPYVGQQHQLETLIEYRVEMMVSAEYLSSVLEKFFDAHPYETPAYDVTETLDCEAWLAQNNRK